MQAPKFRISLCVITSATETSPGRFANVHVELPCAPFVGMSIHVRSVEFQLGAPINYELDGGLFSCILALPPEDFAKFLEAGFKEQPLGPPELKVVKGPSPHPS